MKLFVINEETVKKIGDALKSYINHIDEECGRSGCLCDLRGAVCSQWISDVLHDFESGLTLK